MRKVILGAAAATMLAGSSMAHAAAAADMRTASPVGASEQQFAGGELWLILLGIGLAAFILSQINDSDDVDLPTSP